jgi:type IV pilus assembly protein PilA
LVILGVLTAILLPTFLGTTTQAKNRSAQSDLTNAVTATSSLYAQTQSFGLAPAVATSLGSSEPELSFVGSTAAMPAISGLHNILVITFSSNQVILATVSTSGSCYYASVNMGTTGGSGATSGTQYVQSGTNGTCATTAPTTGWQSTMP